MTGACGTQKEALASLLRREEPSSDLSFEVTDDAIDIGLFEDGLLFGSAEEKSGAAETVDPPRGDFNRRQRSLSPTGLV